MPHENGANDEVLLDQHLPHCLPFCVFDLILKKEVVVLAVEGFVGFGWGRFGGHLGDQGGRA